MAKQIIILEVTRVQGTDINVRWLFWLYPAAGREVPLPGATSAWRGASAAELDALRTGAVVEESYETQWPAGSTKAQIQALLVAMYNRRATEFAGRLNPNQYYGVAYDPGIGWSA